MSTINRLHNVTNPFQTETKKVLCVCSAGLLRSPTLANVLYEEYGYNTRAVGASEEYALIPMDMVHAEWADEIVFVDRPCYFTAKERIDLTGRPVKILDIPDRYAWDDGKLKLLCLKQYNDADIMAKAL